MSESDEEELKKQIKSAWGYMEDTLGDFGFDPAKSVFSEFDLSMSPLSIIGNAALKGLRPNILSKSRKFPAIVLLPFQAPHSDVAGAHEPAGSSEKVQACKAFVPTLHAACLNPFSVTDTMLRAALISSFPTFYAESTALEPLVPGSLIEVSFDNKYDHWSSGIIKEIILARPVEMPDWAVDVPGATDLFNNWPQVVGRGITMLGRYLYGSLPSLEHIPMAEGTTSANLNAFVEKMKASGYFDDFTDASLIGAAVNAQHESAFISNNAGDRWNSGYALRGIETNSPTHPPGEFCSFGYWQLNVCSSTAGGGQFANSMGIPLSDKTRLLDAIVNIDNQFKYVSQAARSLGLHNYPNTFEGAATAAGQFAAKFEICVDCQPREPEYNARYADGAAHGMAFFE